ncbi:AMP-binding protein [Shewanella donghaensis]|uniref:AMP-binding protein n=1 Tax=Shewanella donghaensis TaxID=238836 RepID=UPI001182F0B6|nr:AMP-binding protein [Shewanella donghaensis]
MSVNDLSMSFWQTIEQQAAKKQIFAYVKNKKITYKNLAENIKRLSGFFYHNNLKSVLLISNNEQFIAEISIAALINGVVFSVVDADTKQPRFDSVVDCFKPDFIFMDSGLTIQLKNDFCLLAESKPASTIASIFKGDSQKDCYPHVLKKYTERLPDFSHNQLMAYVLFTSGTTSTPKGVQISTAALFSHLRTLSEVYRYKKDSHILNSLKLSHADGLVQGPMLALFNSITWSHLGLFEISKAANIFDYIVANDISHLITVPIVLGLLYKYAPFDDAFQSEHFYCVVSTGGALSAELWQGFEGKYQTIISNLYGLTETCAGGVFTEVSNDPARIGCIGKAVDMQFVLGVPEQLNDSDEGVLWLKGNNVMTGYLNSPNETHKVFKGEWLNTGDIARLNSNGTLSIIGREKDLINAGGYAIYPQEVNESLCIHPSITNAYTTSRHDDVYGEYIVSLIELSTTLSSFDVINHARQYLEEHKLPRTVYFTASIPLGVSGKVNQEQAEILINEQDSSTNIDYENQQLKLLNIAASIFSVELAELSLNSSAQTTAGWDSLGHLMLITEAEQQFNVQLSPIEIMQITTLSQLFKLVTSKAN